MHFQGYMTRGRSNFLGFILFFLFAVCANGQDSVFSFGIPEALSSSINSSGEEIMPLVSTDGTELFFVRTNYRGNHDGKKGQDIWYSQFANGSWSLPTNELGPLNNNNKNATVGISKDGQKLFLLNNYNRKSEELLEVSSSVRSGNTWEKPRYYALPELFTLGEFYDFYLTPDESVLIVSMAGAKTEGKEDLYVCLKTKGGNWTDPINLGKSINTSGFEMSPFLAPDKRTLYFSSNGHPGQGGADIFVSRRTGESWVKWSEPENLGPPVNTKGFDAYFVFDQNCSRAFYSHTNDKGNFDLYSTTVTVEVVQSDTELAGVNAGAPIEPYRHSGFLQFGSEPAGEVELRLLDEKDKVVQTVRTDEMGFFRFDQFENNRNYLVAVNVEDEQQLRDSKLFLSNEISEKLVFIEDNNLGVFAFKALNLSEYSGFDAFEKQASAGQIANQSTIEGVFKRGTLPMEPVKLKLMDEEDNVVLETKTDSNGTFLIEGFVPKKNYLVSIEEGSTGLAEVFEVYLNGRATQGSIVVKKINKYLFSFTALPEDYVVAEKIPSGDLVESARTSLESLHPDLKRELKTRKLAGFHDDKSGSAPEEETASSATPRADHGQVLQFDKDSWSLNDVPANYHILIETAEKMQKDPKLRLSIQGHTCDLGSSSNNQRLAELRAQNTRNYLVLKGASADQITIRKVGPAQPAAPNDSETNRARNRRVVLSFE